MMNLRTLLLSLTVILSVFVVACQSPVSVADRGLDLTAKAGKPVASPTPTPTTSPVAGTPSPTPTPTPIVATVYNVGPGQAYTNIVDVPWESLNAGDTVNIYYRAAAYKEKILINRQGTASAPITVRGIPGPNGELPVLDGNGAVSRLALEFGSEARGIIQLCTSVIPADTQPQYIVIEGLEVINAVPPYSFTDDSGATQSYANLAAGIWILHGDNITVRNCKVHNCGNGLTTYTGDSTNVYTRNIVLEGNYFYDNGNTGSATEHNTYTESVGITYQYNRMGNPKPSSGNNLKDRSSGTVIRYNWIEGGNKQMDLVDAEDSATITGSADYNAAYIYGNVVIEPVADGNYYFINFGGDQGGVPDKVGPLYVYNNTFITDRTDTTFLVRHSARNGATDARNNIIYNSAGVMKITDGGSVALSHNWLKTGWVAYGTVTDDGTNVVGTDPGFVNLAGKDYHLAAGSACINAGGALNSAVLAKYNLTTQYVLHQTSATRLVNGSAIDIGAFEY